MDSSRALRVATEPGIMGRAVTPRFSGQILRYDIPGVAKARGQFSARLRSFRRDSGVTVNNLPEGACNGVNAVAIGIRPSPETRAKMSASRRASQRVAAAMAAAGEARRGRPLPPAHRARLAAANIGKQLGNRNTVEAPVKGECVYCGAAAREYDHPVPLKRGGPDVEPNRVLCCRSCNASKGIRTPEEWLADGLIGERP